MAAALTAGAAVLASEQLGLAERCLEMTVAYLKERHQFARPIGSFQALKHRLADLWVGVTQARAAARYAAACLAREDPDTPVAVALAKAACSDIAVKAAQECVQLHGGIGFTWEHPAHLYLKRAKSSSIGFGTADHHRASLAGLVDLPPPARPSGARRDEVGGRRRGRGHRRRQRHRRRAGPAVRGRGRPGRGQRHRRRAPRRRSRRRAAPCPCPGTRPARRAWPR